MPAFLRLLPLIGSAFAADDAFNVSLIKEGLKIISSEAVEVSGSPMRVVGTLPTWLNGRYYRNGPGKFEVEEGQGMNGSQHVNSVFDGYAVVNMFEIDGHNNKAYRSTKFLNTPRYQQLLKRGDMSYQGKIMLGTTPERKDYANPFYLGGEFSVSFIRLGGAEASDVQHLLASGEMAYMMEIDPKTLETIDGTDKGAPGMTGNFFKFDDDLAELGMGCAHPITFPNGDQYTKITAVSLLSAGSLTQYEIVKIAAGSRKRQVLAKYSALSLGNVYAHSFAMPSTKYAVLPMWPLFSEKTGLANKDLFPGFKWDPSRGTDVVVLDLETGKSTRFHVNETIFGFHVVNSWMETNAKGGEDIVFDLSTMKDDSVFTSLMWEKMQDGTNLGHMDECSDMKRIRIPLSSATFIEQRPGIEEDVFAAEEVATVVPLSSTRIETPQINNAYLNNGKYQFIYGWHATKDGNHPNSIAKIDVRDGSAKIWKDDDEFGVMTGEAVFYAAPDAKSEDDGVLISAGLHVRTGEAFVHVVDAKTMKEVARMYHEEHITFGFHGMYIPDAAASEGVAYV